MTDNTELKKLIIDVVKDPSLNSGLIEDSTELVSPNGLIFDSIDTLALITEIDKRYGIKVKDNDIIPEKFKTFATLTKFINENEKK